jgi:hypothetical protein
MIMIFLLFIYNAFVVTVLRFILFAGYDTQEDFLSDSNYLNCITNVQSLVICYCLLFPRYPLEACNFFHKSVRCFKFPKKLLGYAINFSSFEKGLASGVSGVVSGQDIMSNKSGSVEA